MLYKDIIKGRLQLEETRWFKKQKSLAKMKKQLCSHTYFLRLIRRLNKTLFYFLLLAYGFISFLSIKNSFLLIFECLTLSLLAFLLLALFGSFQFLYLNLFCLWFCFCFGFCNKYNYSVPKFLKLLTQNHLWFIVGAALAKLRFDYFCMHSLWLLLSI